MPQEEKQPINLDAIAELAMRKTLRMGSHVPLLMAEGDKRAVMVPMLEMPSTSDDRARQMFGLGMILAEDADLGILQQVFFICEAWMNTPAGKGKEEERIRPSQDPQRKEVLIISGLNVRTDDMDTKIYEMKRDEREKLLSLDHVEIEATHTDSPLLRAFAQGFLGMLKGGNE